MNRYAVQAALLCVFAAWCQASPGAGKPGGHGNSSCSTLPTINPSKGFTANFNNSCYALSFGGSSGGSSGGDSNATYTQVFYQVNPAYQLIVLGTFPNARFMSVTLYDAHSTLLNAVNDFQIPPLSNSMSNPYVPGHTYTTGQMYGLTVSFGGGAIQTVAAGCSTSGSNLGATVFNATELHEGLSWNGAPGLPAGFPVHQSGPNTGGTIMVREYIGISTEAAPVVIVRQLSNGCALPLAQAESMNIISVTQSLTNSPWLNQPQIQAHHVYYSTATLSPTECYPNDPENQVQWVRSSDWVGRNNAAAAYASVILPPATLQSLFSGQHFIRIQFPVPTTPSIPCATPGCTITGNEQLRYLSVEFLYASPSSPTSTGSSSTLIALNDMAFVLDPNRNATLIVGLGGTPPPEVNPSNYYTYLDLTKVPGYVNFNAILLRNLLPNPLFECSTFNMPSYTMEYNPAGGFMGAFVPTVDFPDSDDLMGPPIPPVRPNTCAVVPPPPTACNVTRTPV
jgi:hypothetical protein